MKREKWYEDQPVLKNDLDWAQTSKEEAIKERVVDSSVPGVLNGFLVEQGPAAGLFITIGTGAGISPAGERIVISSVSTYSSTNPSLLADNGIGGTAAVPQSTGSENIPVSNNATNYIWLGYLETADSTTFTLSNTTHERLFVKRNDGFEVVITTVSTNPDSTRYIQLAEVVTSGGSVTSINTTNDKEDAATLVTTVPGSPYELSLPVLPNLHATQHRPASIPVISGFTYTTGTPAAGQFTVDFTTGIVVFNAADTGASISVDYEVEHIRRHKALMLNTGVQLTLNQSPATYERGTLVSVNDHINARGGGIISPTNPHGLTPADIGLSGVTDLGGVLASPGVVIDTADASTFTSALSPSAVSAFLAQDNVVAIAPLVAGESINIFGTIATATEIPNQSLFTFVDATLTPIAVGTYYFYVDKETRSVQRNLGSYPTDAFPIASIYWDGSSLELPITDLRTFGTVAKNNLRLETLLGLVTGSATDNRTYTFYNAVLLNSESVSSPDYAYTALGGTTLNIDVDGSPESVTFAVSPANTTLSQAISAINAQTSIYASKTSDNRIKLLAEQSLEVTGGSAAAILGFTVGQTDNEDPSFVVSAANNAVDFKVNAGSELNATLTSGTYRMGANSSQPDTLCAEVKTQLEVADPSGVYTVTFNSTSLKVTITRNSGTIQILWATGTNTATAADALLGFTTADTSAAISLTSDSTTASPVYIASNDDIKEMRISGSSSAIGAGGETIDAAIEFTYNIDRDVVRVVALAGNKVLTTEISYRPDGSISSMQETIT